MPTLGMGAFFYCYKAIPLEGPLYLVAGLGGERNTCCQVWLCGAGEAGGQGCLSIMQMGMASGLSSSLTSSSYLAFPSHLPQVLQGIFCFLQSCVPFAHTPCCDSFRITFSLSSSICCLAQARGFSGGSVVKNPPSVQEVQGTGVQSLGWEDPLEEEMALQYSCLENSMDIGAHGLQSMGLQSQTQLSTHTVHTDLLKSHICYGFPSSSLYHLRFL